MNFFQRLKFAFTGKLPSPQAPRPRSRGEAVIAAMFPHAYGGWPGATFNQRINQVNHYRNWTFTGIHTKAKKVSQFHPNIAYLIEDDNPREPKKRLKFRKALGPVKPHEELDPVSHKHPLRRLLAKPNPVDTAMDLWYELEMYKNLCGIAYLWAVPNDLGTVAELWCIPSHWVFPRSNGQTGRLIDYYEIRPWNVMGMSGMLKFPAEEVIEFKWKSPLTKLDGYSPLWAASQWVDVSESISASRWAQFKNRARPEMWVKLEDKEGGSIYDPDDPGVARIKARIAAMFQGEYASGEPIVMSPGASIEKLSWTPEEMGYVDSEDQVRNEILAALGVPLAAVGLNENMTFGSVLAAQAGFCSMEINPALAYYGQVLTHQLASRWDESLRIWWDDVTPADPAQMNQDLALDLQNGLITINEARAIRGREPYKFGGDDPMLPMGLAPVPFATGQDLSDLGDLMPVLDRKESIRDNPEQGAAGGDGEGDGEGQEQESPFPDIEEPNGPPSKAGRFASHLRMTGMLPKQLMAPRMKSWMGNGHVKVRPA